MDEIMPTKEITEMIVLSSRKHLLKNKGQI